MTRHRDEVQRKHEEAAIKEFVEWLNIENNKHFNTTGYPDPPDALCFDSETGEKIWIEHSDVYRSSDEAREDRSFANPRVPDYVHKEHPIIQPDERTAQSLLAVLHRKISKPYRGAFRAFPGILLLTERDALFSSSTLTAIKSVINDAIHEGVISPDEGPFDQVYLGMRQPFGGRLTFVQLWSR